MPPLTPDSKTYKAIGLLKQSQLKSVSLVEEIATGNRYVAHQLKTPSTLTKEAAATRLAQEADALQRVTHPHVPRFMGYQTTATGNWFLFEYLDGYPLSQHKGDTDKVPDDWLLFWFQQILVTVDQLHQKGVVIGGFEPKHFLVHTDKLYLVHVGILENLFPETLALLRSPERLTFTAPEHRHSIHTSVTGDLYSAGAIAYWLCTGKAPTFGTRVDEEQVRSTIAQSRREFPPAVSNLICKLLQFQAAQRPATAADAVQTLAHYAPDLTGSNPPPPVRPYKVRFFGRETSARLTTEAVEMEKKAGPPRPPLLSPEAASAKTPLSVDMRSMGNLGRETSIMGSGAPPRPVPATPPPPKPASDLGRDTSIIQSGVSPAAPAKPAPPPTPAPPKPAPANLSRETSVMGSGASPPRPAGVDLSRETSVMASGAAPPKPGPANLSRETSVMGSGAAPPKPGPANLSRETSVMGSGAAPARPVGPDLGRETSIMGGGGPPGGRRENEVRPTSPSTPGSTPPPPVWPPRGNPLDVSTAKPTKPNPSPNPLDVLTARSGHPAAPAAGLGVDTGRSGSSPTPPAEKTPGRPGRAPSDGAEAGRVARPAIPGIDSPTQGGRSTRTSSQGVDTGRSTRTSSQGTDTGRTTRTASQGVDVAAAGNTTEAPPPPPTAFQEFMEDFHWNLFRKNPYVGFGLLLAVLVAIVLLLWMVAPGSKETPVSTEGLTLVAGHIDVKSPGQGEGFNPASSITAADSTVVATQHNSPTVIKFGQKSTLRLDEHSTFVYQEWSNHVLRIQLVQGHTFVEPGDGESAEVTVAGAIVECPANSGAEFTVGPGASGETHLPVVKATQGTLTVKTSSGDASLTAGNSINLPEGAPTSHDSGPPGSSETPHF